MLTTRPDVLAYSHCFYGIAKPIQELERGHLHHGITNKTAFMYMSGPDDNVCYFLIDRYPAPLKGDAIPHHSKDDALKFVDEHADHPATSLLRFKDVAARNKSQVLTTLHEHIYKRWHFGRIMTIGDAAHKVSLALQVCISSATRRRETLGTSSEF